MTERQVGPTGVSAGGAAGASGLAARSDGAPVVLRRAPVVPVRNAAPFPWSEDLM